MDNKREYKITIKTNKNDIDFQILVGNDETGWNNFQSCAATKEEKERLMTIAEQFIDFVSK